MFKLDGPDWKLSALAAAAVALLVRWYWPWVPWPSIQVGR